MSDIDLVPEPDFLTFLDFGEQRDYKAIDDTHLELVQNRLEGPTLCHKTTPCLGVFGAKGSIGTVCSALLPGIDRRPDRCPPGGVTSRFGVPRTITIRLARHFNRLQ